MNDSTDGVEVRLRALGQVRSSASAHAATEALVLALDDPEVRADLDRVRGPRPRRPTRHRRLVIGSLIALAGIGIGVPAVASSILARTGKFGDPSTSTEVDSTEWLDPGASDLPQVVIDAYPEYLTLPPGMPKNAAIADTTRLLGRMGAEQAAGEAVVQESYAAGLYETFGICAWTDTWLTAHASSDSTTQALATAWIGNAENYRQMASSPSIADRMLVVAKAAEDSNLVTMNEVYTEDACAVRLGSFK